LKIALHDGRFNLSYFRSYETIARLSNPSRLWVEGGAEKSGVMPAELLRGPGDWGEKLLFSESPPASRTSPTRELVHSDHVHGQTSWRAEKAFDKLWKSSYNFSTRLFTPNLPRVLQCAPRRRSRGAYDAPSIIRAYSSGFCSRFGIRKTRAIIQIHGADVCLRCTSSGTKVHV